MIPDGRTVRVRVPATSANLGPGFDALGLALAWYDEVEMTVTGDRPSAVQVDGEGAGDVPLDDSHLIVASARTCLAAKGFPPTGLRLTCHNTIPQARGLGSSAAAIVTGVLGAQVLAGGAPDDIGVFELAASIEGHPDNVAACVGGGATIAWQGKRGPRFTAFRPHPRIVPVVLIPDHAASTAAARAALPDVVGHSDAARNAGRAALLVRALTDRPDLLLDATEDRLHQDQRARVIPDTLRLVHELRSHGLPATVSGAGPAVLVLAVDTSVGAAHAFAPPGWSPRRVDVDVRGATVTSIGE